ncbi:hypothetical protein ACWEGM_27890, partial [Streptomyces nigra]
MARGGSRRDLIPDFDPDCGDAALTRARQDIVIGRWQGLRSVRASSVRLSCNLRSSSRFCATGS